MRSYTCYFVLFYVSDKVSTVRCGKGKVSFIRILVVEVSVLSVKY